MTDRAADEAGVEAQRARLDALRERRPTGQRRDVRRKHPARRTRIGVATSSLAAMFGLVGAMALLRPPTVDPPPDTRSALPPLVAVGVTGTTTAPSLPTPAPPPTPAPSPSPAPVPVPVPSPVPVPLTARPHVQVTTPTQPAPTPRTHGSH
jgi:hypothetical protein